MTSKDFTLSQKRIPPEADVEVEVLAQMRVKKMAGERPKSN